MSKNRSESMKSELQGDLDAPSQPPNNMADSPSDTPAQHMPPEPEQPVSQQSLPAAPFPPPPVSIQYIQQQTTYFGRNPTPTVCTRCRKNVVTQIRPTNGKITYTTAACCCILGGLVCFPFPFYMNCLRDVEHFCPECSVSLGRFKRW